MQSTAHDKNTLTGFETDDLLNGSGAGKAGRIRRILEERFETGRYRFGEKLSVTDLSREFGVSRQPVMMAIRELRSDGFVIITPQVGSQAASPDKKEIEDFFSIFAKMEGRITGLAAERHDVNQLTQLQSVLEKLEAASGNSKNWDLERISEFHTIIRDMAKSPNLANRLARFWSMANYIIKNGKESYTKEMHIIGNRERRNIVDAIADRNVTFAELLMEKHVLGKPRRVHLL